ncbi:NUDIX domain-containing protein [Psychromarinibacter sp. C21-152]|uniref:ADP-ribose pyrophosphatase n=1 Tax=Psychromarinibacter sediminicola TaxID=3033385 RepID=A0AAE3NU06_9RHOB|nr:NUDIX domain-containing protein [Psychromarinibacter sediminicola]MDF0602022.1 NUDIX domain-containing protein [Psychromarinibacter sediminicola]
MAVFLYGTLRYAPVLKQVLGPEAKADARPARLGDHALCDSAQGPVPVPQAGGTVPGILLEPDPALRARLDFYAAVRGHYAAPVTVQTDAGAVPARAFVPRAATPGGPWRYEDWQVRHGAAETRLAQEIMERYGAQAAGEVAAHLSQAAVRASSWVRAAADSAPNAVRRGGTAEDVRTEERRRPYVQFFAVEEQDLRFRHFDGGESETVTRAAFVMGDAVTVLPYDPVRDRVLMVEQFRFGPFARGDRHPWSLEPVAGRIDPGEGPESTAYREAEEEAGVALRGLELVARYYPSPGAVSEYLWSYVGLCDLPDGTAQIGGLDHEHEDIRGVVLDWSAFTEFLGGREAENGPLILTGLWLAANRERLRSGA